MKRLRLLGALALVAAAACSPKNNGTLLVAHVDTDLVDSVGAQQHPDPGRAPARRRLDGHVPDHEPRVVADAGDRPSGDPAFSIDVTAIGKLGSTTVVSQTATVAFAPGEAREFTLFLAQDCVNAVPCTRATNVCIKGGSCVPKTQVAQTQALRAERR